MQLNLQPNSLQKPHYLSVVSPLKTTVFHYIVNFTNRTPLVVHIKNNVISDVTYASLLVLLIRYFFEKNWRIEFFFQIRMSVCQPSVLEMTSSVMWHVRVRLAGTTYFSKITSKQCFLSSDQRII